MNQRRFFAGGAVLILISIAILFSMRGALAQNGPGPTQEGAPPQFPSISSASYHLNWDVIANGGGVMTSSSYRMQSTIGQNVIGTSSSASYSVHAGFWQLLYNALYLPIIRR